MSANDPYNVDRIGAAEGRCAVKKTNLTLIVFVLLGLLAGTLIGQLLSPVQALSFLAKSLPVTWEPKANLQVVQYELHLVIRLNLFSLLGLAGAVWLYRRL